MLTPQQQSDRLNKAQLRAFGEPIAYTPAAGGAAIDTKCLLLKAPLQQSMAPGYFAHVEVDPAVITDPQKGDIVTWADGTVYQVERVTNSPYGLTLLELHATEDVPNDGEDL
ncbi:MAG TPA: hypothetical protein VN736_28695 [Candidatus Limnocylindrales bacterium]|nr:hypothetical protein [Candidatus Limnocylindrales bacterium]